MCDSVERSGRFRWGIAFGLSLEGRGGIILFKAMAFMGRVVWVSLVMVGIAVCLRFRKGLCG